MKEMSLRTVFSSEHKSPEAKVSRHPKIYKTNGYGKLDNCLKSSRRTLAQLAVVNHSLTFCAR
jgi:hypothetical protein